jgi:hypothetical protein
MLLYAKVKEGQQALRKVLVGSRMGQPLQQQKTAAKGWSRLERQ